MELQVSVKVRVHGRVTGSENHEEDTVQRNILMIHETLEKCLEKNQG